MPHSHAVNGASRARWPIIILVVGSVAAASLALGLLVVGPMIQRRMETPPPVLAISGTTAMPPSQQAVSAADVEIRERIIRRPAPRPAPPKPDDLNVELGPAPAPSDAAAGLTDLRANASGTKPSIKATVTDAAGTTNSQGTDANGVVDQGTREGHRIPRHTEDAANPNSDSGSGQAGTNAEPRPRSSPAPKARTRRASPLDALPFLDPNGPGTSADKQLPDAAPAASPDARSNGKSYRVQVGRFSDEREAAKLRDELAQSGLSPRVVKTQRGGATVYRVQVGTYHQKENADRQIETLKSRSYEPYLADEEP